MKKELVCAGLLAPLFLAGMAGYAVADVKIILKNESSILADECREEADRLVCYKMGGSFEIEKRDVLSMKNVTVRQPRPGAEPDGVAAAAESRDSGGKADDKTGETPVAGKTEKSPASVNPPDASAQQRLLLQAEREALLKERQQLQDEVKKAPDWMTTKQFDELNKRNAELDARVKRFNEEAGRLSGQKKQAVPEESKQ